MGSIDMGDVEREALHILLHKEPTFIDRARIHHGYKKATGRSPKELGKKFKVDHRYLSALYAINQFPEEIHDSWLTNGSDEAALLKFAISHGNLKGKDLLEKWFQTQHTADLEDELDRISKSLDIVEGFLHKAWSPGSLDKMKDLRSRVDNIMFIHNDVPNEEHMETEIKWLRATTGAAEGLD